VAEQAARLMVVVVILVLMPLIVAMRLVMGVVVPVVGMIMRNMRVAVIVVMGMIMIATAVVAAIGRGGRGGAGLVMLVHGHLPCAPSVHAGQRANHPTHGREDERTIWGFRAAGLAPILDLKWCRCAGTTSLYNHREVMMERMKRILARWGLLAAGLLAGAGLALHEGQPHYPPSLPPRYATPEPTGVYTEPVYTVPQILAGWGRDPGRWVGHTVLVRSSFNGSCAGPGRPPDGRAAFPCIYPGQSDVTEVLYDGASGATIPATHGQEVSTIDPLGDAPAPKGVNLAYWDPVAVWRVTLGTRRDCGPLAHGGPCLLARVAGRAGY
jgi:hypothetical protein